MTTIFKSIPKFNIQIGKASSAGNIRRENQDTMFVISKPEIDCTILAVADGHGRDTGALASNVCKISIEEYTDSNLALLNSNPVLFLSTCNSHVQQKLRDAFVEYATQQNFEAKIDENGVVLQRKTPNSPFTSISGGSTLSIVVFKNGILYSANVGDSTGMLCVKKPTLKLSDIKYERDVARDGFTRSNTDNTPVSSLIITSDTHSPEDVDEYIRIRNFRRSGDKAELLFVFDDQDREKPSCPHVFKISEDGTPTVEVPANQFYYKNVRKDRATYVCAPYSANHPDALASTRSIGDFNLNTYGVSEKPEIHSVNMNTVFEQMVGDENPIAAVVLCSDGIWDNWLYDHVQKFAMDHTCLNRIKSKPEDGAQDVANSFSVRNEQFARKNFGGNRDDQTCIIMYITPSI